MVGFTSSASTGTTRPSGPSTPPPPAKKPPETLTQYVEVPVPNSADTKAWRFAKQRMLAHNPNKTFRAVDLFREVEAIKELALSGDPDGTLIQ